MKQNHINASFINSFIKNPWEGGGEGAGGGGWNSYTYIYVKSAQKILKYFTKSN